MTIAAAAAASPPCPSGRGSRSRPGAPRAASWELHALPQLQRASEHAPSSAVIGLLLPLLPCREAAAAVDAVLGGGCRCLLAVVIRGAAARSRSAALSAQLAIHGRRRLQRRQARCSSCPHPDPPCGRVRRLLILIRRGAPCSLRRALASRRTCCGPTVARGMGRGWSATQVWVVC